MSRIIASLSISFFFPKSTYISNNHVIHRFFNVIDIGTNSARKGTTRRLINSRRGVVSADLIRAWAQGGCWKPFPLLSDVRRVGLAPQGSLVPRAASQGRAKNRFLPLSLSLSPRDSCFLIPLAPDSPPSVSVSGVTLQQLCSPEKFPVALSTYLMSPPSTPLMLLVRNLPARPVRFPRFLFLHGRFVSWLPCLF